MPISAIPTMPGIVKDETPTMAKPRWVAGDRVRFVNGLPEVCGGYESVILSTFAGKCRGLHSWQLANGAWAIAIGTNTHLYVCTGGSLYDITPVDATGTLTGPFAMISGSATVTVTHATHGRSVGDRVLYSGATAVGGLTISGEYTVASVSSTGSYTITAASAATSTATGGGTVTYTYLLPVGLADGTGGLGFGTGAYGVGPYGQSSAIEYRPRFWTLDNFATDLVACPLNRTIYRWTGNTAQRAQALSGAPARVDTMFLDPRGLVVACGANEQVSGTFNPLLVRNSDIEAITDWSASLADQAGEFPVRIGSRLVRGLPARGTNLLWTDAALLSMTYTGDPGSIYSFDVLGGECGLIGANAAIVVNGSAYWMGSNGQFYMWTGGAPQTMACTVRRWIMDNLSYVQADKIVAFSNAAFTEIGWLYPDIRDGNECSRMVLLNLLDGSWSTHTTDRTCRVDARALPSPVSATAAGRLYFEERGHSADGGALSWSLTGSRVEIGSGDTILEVQEIRPDFQRLVGGADIYLDSYAYPQSPAVAHGPFTATSATETLYPLVTARQVSVRLQGTSAPADMRLGALLLDVVDTGDRV